MPGAGITIGNGTLSKQIVATTGRWQVRMRLSMGDNPLFIVATKVGYGQRSFNWNVTRTLTPARVAARRAAGKARALATKTPAHARVLPAEASFKSSTSTISYAGLLKDSSPFMGKHVSFRGKVRSIRQNGTAGGFMLVSVTRLHSGLWTNNVWMDYDSVPTAGANDVITMYGTVTGTTSYASQTGGRTYVPEIHARYIDLSG